MTERKLLERRKTLNKPERKGTLIICEDSKSSKNYFHDMCKCFGLEKTVAVEHFKETCPWRIVEKAKENKEYHEKIYCVFDKDTHKHYQKALNWIKTNGKGKIMAINSVPCFEYWILLHFENTSKAFGKVDARQSSSEILEKSIRNYLPEYYKGMNDLFDKTKKGLAEAIRNAEKNVIKSEKEKYNDPFTKIHELVRALQKLRDKPTSS